MTAAWLDHDLDARLRAWVADGLLSADQAARIAAREDLEAAGPVPEPLVREAVSWVGGVLVLAAAVVLSGVYWADLRLLPRALLLGGAAVLLVGVGAAAGRRAGAAGNRVRAVLWLLSVAAAAGLLGVLGDQAIGLDGEGLGLLVALGAAAWAGALWRLQPRVPQQLGLFVPLLAAAGLAGSLVSDGALLAISAGLWLVSAAWGVLARSGRLGDGGAGTLLAAVGLLYAALTLSAAGGVGHALAVGTAVVLLVAAVVLRQLPLLGLGAVGLLLVLPQAVNAVWPSQAAPAVALLLAGALVLGVGVRGWHRPDA